MDKMKVSLKTLIEKDKVTYAKIKSLKRVLRIMWKRGNFVHMDLHAENIWYDYNGKARLIDFDSIVTLSTLEETKPYIFSEFDSPQITNAETAIYNSSFDVRNLIDSHYNNSNKKDQLNKLKEVVSGNGVTNNN